MQAANPFPPASPLLALPLHPPEQISIMKMVKHDNVVKLYEVLASRTKIFIVLELITGGELFDKIVAEGRFDENTARYYFRQLIKGVKYCHSQGERREAVAVWVRSVWSCSIPPPQPPPPHSPTPHLLPTQASATAT